MDLPARAGAAAADAELPESGDGLTLKLPSLWPLAVLAVGLLGLHCYNGAVGDAAVEKVAREQAERTAAHYRQAVIVMGSRIPKVDTVAGKAKMVFVAAKVDYQRIADSIAATLQPGEPLPPVVRACNAALAAADTALSACARQVAIRDSALALRDTLAWAQDSVIAHLRKRKPFFTRLTRPILPFALGAAAGFLLRR